MIDDSTDARDTAELERSLARRIADWRRRIVRPLPGDEVPWLRIMVAGGEQLLADVLAVGSRLRAMHGPLAVPEQVATSNPAPVHSRKAGA